MYRHLFGPVPSRRLGLSLGIDLVPPKVCSCDCVYCECGPTTDLTTVRAEHVPVQAVLDELADWFAHNPDPDYITLSGSGEPTLNNRAGEVIRYAKALRPAVPVAVLTNATLLTDPQVRREILAADVVLPSLDAATEAVFRALDRPAPGLSVAACIEALVAFRKEYAGAIWLETMLLPGYNDHPEELAALREAYLLIRPDRIQLNTLDRPGTEPGLAPLPPERLQEIIREWALPEAECIAPAAARSQSGAWNQNMENRIMETLARRPCTTADLAGVLGVHANEINKYLSGLEAEHKIRSEAGGRGTFYRLRL